jgi:hypothetical protein
MSAKARGQSFAISAAVIRTLDLIAWDFDPAVGEPPSAVLLVLALPILCLARRNARDRG